ncbi:hypothetical protein TREMEDRAFT_59695 [Tremella mesenterica DSM 1558]|uniref:uncharacterized protein n=1 Tax=Tremella mesenterica (strain ATCC 24925 / CBS 8224 / DSM 1558 / NBRC 9311 / NRRL Y-6157 / RJB 2259-6 / UBC 559-6) TaxID=578456 RepID=UPI0003F4A294|nr:uncharacterized protein TREMEDRAFT_59695 [Tremella mesenterica DSM 1558]EIW73522.1 hypothetical protein TREMEDRAFT_59695 [Tremella mesenterica DSM 1558]
MSFVTTSIIDTVLSRIPLSRNPSSMSTPTERQPLLSGTVNGHNPPNPSSLRREVSANMPTEGQKIKFAQVSGALVAGKLPSQEQISELLEIVIESDTLKPTGGPNSRTARLGQEGQRVLENLKEVLRAVKSWGEEKNKENLIQNFFYNASSAEVDVDLKNPSIPSQKELSKDAQRAIESARTIAKLVVTNDAFRQLGSQVILLTRDVLADAASVAAEQAQKAADKTRPSEQERQEGIDFKGLEKKGKQTAKGLKSGKLQGEARESIWDEVERLKEYADEKLPEGEEARDKLIQRLQQVVTQAQSDPEYRRAITAIVNLFKKYSHKAEDAVKETADKSEISDEDEKVQQAGRDLKAFVEKVSGKSIDDLISAAQKAGEDVKNDDKLSAYFKELDSYVHRILYQPGYVASRAAYRKAVALYDDGQSLIAENPTWKADAGELQKQLEELVNGVTNDQATNRLVQAIENLGDTLLTAGQIGLNSLKVEGKGLYRDFADVILPRLVGLVKELPVPRVEFKSEDIDLVIDDFNLESASFIPDSIRFVQHNDIRFTQGYATYASEYDGTVRLRVEGLHFEANNIAFWAHKKTGFMPFQDSGILSLKFGPKGISFDVTLENADEEDRESFFTVKTVQVDMSGFEFSISKNYHWIATWFASPLLRAVVKRNLTSALEEQIAEYLRNLDFQTFALQQRAIAATNAKPTPGNFIRAVVSDSIFPQQRTGPVKVGSKGVVKYGRHGEYLLHIGVDEELFPDKPAPHLRNPQRQKLKSQAAQLQGQAKRAVGSADQFKKTAKGGADKAKAEGSNLSARVKEEQRRASRTEGWRSEAFDV